MKKIILLLGILAAMNVSAKSRSEMIREDLSKLGISQEIIAKTIELDREMTNVAAEPDMEKVGNVVSESEKLLKKNEKNFVLSENLINIYNAVGKSDAEKLNNLKRYEKYNPHEVSKLFFSNMYYSNKGDMESFDKNYEKLKEKYPDYLIFLHHFFQLHYKYLSNFLIVQNFSHFFLVIFQFLMPYYLFFHYQVQTSH